MRVFPAEVPDGTPVRPRNWGKSASGGQYYPLRENPELISELEDFKPLIHYKSVQLFLDLLRWMTEDDCPFESNDSRMRPPQPNNRRDLTDKELVREGALMFFFHKLEANLSEDSKDWFKKFNSYQIEETEVRPTPNEYCIWLRDCCQEELQQINPESLNDWIDISLYPVVYEEAPVPSEERFGIQIVFWFSVCGDTDDEIMANFEKTVSAMTQCLKAIAAEML
jgi:hypothetical protein